MMSLESNFKFTRLGLMLFSIAATASCYSNEPGITRDRVASSPQLRIFSSCEEMGDSLRSNILAEMEVNLRRQNDWVRGGLLMDGVAEASDSSGTAASPAAGARQEGVDFSGTNNQEKGVDESDFVKTDGYYIYTLNGNRLEILGVPEFGSLERVSTTELEGYPSQMLMGEDKVVVFSTIYPWSLPEDHPLRKIVGTPDTEYGYWYWSQSLTKITVIDVSDRATPKPMRELYIEGSQQAARRVDSTVRLITYGLMQVPGLIRYADPGQEYWELDSEDPRRKALWEHAIDTALDKNKKVLAAASLDELVPRLIERTGNDTFITHSFASGGCNNFAMPEDSFARGISSILTLDLLKPEFKFEADHILTNWSTVYASPTTLVLAESAFNSWWFWENGDTEEQTNIHRFDISKGATTRYTGSGRVPGTLWSQFNLSEYEGNIRVAATTGRLWRWWGDDGRPSPVNHVYVLAGDKPRVIGHIGGIAPGETIWSSRFVGPRGFLVTFRNIDPLWTIDLSDPTNPVVEGELEVPGVSTYIHPVSDGENRSLLTIGYGGDTEGMRWWEPQISLFDVTDFSDPKVADQISLAQPTPDEGWSYAWSEAAWNPKAFQYWQPKGLLAIPLSSYRGYWSGSRAGRGTYRYEYFSRLQLIDVDLSGNLSLHGVIDHSDFFNSDNERYWSSRDVRRTIFMGDYIYAISDRGVTVHNAETLAPGPRVALPGNDGAFRWWYY